MTDARAPSAANAPTATILASLGRLVATVRTAYRGPAAAVEDAVVCLLARGHLLIEDVPGVGKTTLASALGKALGVGVHRVQFTPDTLPSDILGLTVFNVRTQEFEFHPGPVFTPVLLADEINRATPKTQAALLQAMSERAVSSDGVTRPLPEPFLVLATQNPVEYLGTYPLPESQLDRFLMRISLGYPAPEDERRLLLSGGADRVLAALAPALTLEELAAAQAATERVTVADKLMDYVLAIVGAHAERQGPAPRRLAARLAGLFPRGAGARSRLGPALRHARRRQARRGRHARAPGSRLAAGSVGRRGERAARARRDPAHPRRDARSAVSPWSSPRA